jgi:hypothetical protein
VATWNADDRWDPRNPENRERTRILQQEMRAHLMRWDPIGVGDAPEAQDEYDAYISPLLHMLHRHEPVEAISAWLTTLVEEHIGVRSHPDREQHFAETLTDWWITATGG